MSFHDHAAVVRPVRAMAGETVRITWTFPDGTTLEESRTAPPEHVRMARQQRAAHVRDAEDSRLSSRKDFEAIL